MSYKVKKPCRICGKMYTPCADCEGDKNIFHWRTVACSLKCATEYFKKVEESRKSKDGSIAVSVAESVMDAENIAILTQSMEHAFSDPYS